MKPSTLHELCLRYLDGDLSEKEEGAFGRLIAESKEAARVLARCAIHDQFFESGRALLDSDASIPQPADAFLNGLLGSAGSDHSDKMTMRRASGLAYFAMKEAARSKPARWLAAAAAIALIALVAVQFLGPGPSTPPKTPGPIAEDEQVVPVATLTAVHHAQWRVASGTLSPSVGEGLQAGDSFTLIDGFAQITTEQGAVAVIEAPATIELLDNPNAIRLAEGKLVGICETESSKGLLVRTPFMDVVDLGTEFGVEVDASGTAATVFTGEVEVSTTTGPAQLLRANQTARLVRSQVVIVQEELLQGFSRRMPREAVVASASINVQGHQVAVVPQGFEEDVRMHSDRDYELNGMDTQGLPAALIGGDLIQVPLDARFDQALEIEAEFARPAEVYILWKAGIDPLPWLERDYTRTTMRVGLDFDESRVPEGLGIGPGNSIDLALEVWQRKQPATGRIVVGQEMAKDSAYAIVALPSEDVSNHE